MIRLGLLPVDPPPDLFAMVRLPHRTWQLEGFQERLALGFPAEVPDALSGQGHPTMFAFYSPEQSCVSMFRNRRVYRGSTDILYWPGANARSSGLLSHFARLQLRDDAFGNSNLRAASTGQQSRVDLHADITFTEHEDAQERP
jgi:hypothetical protein